MLMTDTCDNHITARLKPTTVSMRTSDKIQAFLHDARRLTLTEYRSDLKRDFTTSQLEYADWFVFNLIKIRKNAEFRSLYLFDCVVIWQSALNSSLMVKTRDFYFIQSIATDMVERFIKSRIDHRTIDGIENRSSWHCSTIASIIAH